MILPGHIFTSSKIFCSPKNYFEIIFRQNLQIIVAFLVQSKSGNQHKMQRKMCISVWHFENFWDFEFIICLLFRPKMTNCGVKMNCGVNDDVKYFRKIVIFNNFQEFTKMINFHVKLWFFPINEQ